MLAVSSSADIWMQRTREGNKTLSSVKEKVTNNGKFFVALEFNSLEAKNEHIVVSLTKVI